MNMGLVQFYQTYDLDRKYRALSRRTQLKIKKQLREFYKSLVMREYNKMVR